MVVESDGYKARICDLKSTVRFECYDGQLLDGRALIYGVRVANQVQVEFEKGVPITHFSTRNYRIRILS